MAYQIRIKSEGRGGWAFYYENGVTLPIPWELSVAAVSIRLRSQEEWNSFCDKHDAQWAKNSRDIIMQRVAEDVKKYWRLKGNIEIDDSWIHIYEGPGCLARIQSWFFD